MDRRGDAVLVDTRNMLAFGGGHIESALNIAGLPELSIWAGWLLDPQQAVLLVLESDQELDKVVPLFLRTGYTKFGGYLVGGEDEFQIVDVRSPEEWNEGHIPNANHIFLPEIKKRARELAKNKPVAVYCDSGYRASLGASILQNEGFEVHNVPGSWQAWKNAKYPVEK